MGLQVEEVAGGNCEVHHEAGDVPGAPEVREVHEAHRLVEVIEAMDVAGLCALGDYRLCKFVCHFGDFDGQPADGHHDLPNICPGQNVQGARARLHVCFSQPDRRVDDVGFLTGHFDLPNVHSEENIQDALRVHIYHHHHGEDDVEILVGPLDCQDVQHAPILDWPTFLVVVVHT